MEIELKYAVPDERTLDAIWHDERLLSMMEEGTRSVEEFDGIYYDTPDCRLLSKDIAYRIRREGRNAPDGLPSSQKIPPFTLHW